MVIKKLSFDAQLKTAGDIKVPAHVRKIYGLKVGDWFHVSIEAIVRTDPQ